MVVRLAPEAKAALLRRHLDDGVPLTRLAEHCGIGVRTLRRWAAGYRADPTVAGLGRRVRADRGRRRLPEDLVTAIEGLALRRPVPTTAFIHRRVVDLARDRGLPEPSYSTWAHAPWPSAATRPTATGSSWSTAGQLPDPTSSGRPTTPCSTCKSSTLAGGRPARG